MASRHRYSSFNPSPARVASSTARRSDDEEDADDDDYEDENEIDIEEDELDAGRMDVDGEDSPGADGIEEDIDGDAEGGIDGEAGMDGDAEGDLDEDGEEVELDGEGDGSGGEDEDEEEDPDGEDDQEDSDADGDEGDDDDEDDEDDEEDEADKVIPGPAISPVRSIASRKPSPIKRSISPKVAPLPPYKVRRSLLLPAFHLSSPSHLSIDAMVAIPVPAPIHCLAATACSSYLLTGSQEGVVRAYDFYGSVNGGQPMTAQQRSIVGMGDGISKAGMARGWWVSDVSIPQGTDLSEPKATKRVEPVYSLAVEGDGLWALTGTQSGSINLYTLRHTPGQLVHSLKEHESVVSCMTLTTDEKRVLSGSWDGGIRDWDLNTGQSTRRYPFHGAQISSLALRPFAHPMSPSPSPTRPVDANAEADDNAMSQKTHVSVSVGPDFFTPTLPTASSTSAAAAAPTSDQPAISASGTTSDPQPPVNADIEMAADSSPASSYDPLFDDEDADGETAPPSVIATKPGSPIAHPDPAAGPSRPSTLSLPGPGQANGHRSTGQSTPVSAPTHPEGAAAGIPLLSPTTYKQFSDDILLASFIDGQVMLVDRRVPDSRSGVARLVAGDKAPPWCMSACWSGNGNQILAGRRNGTIDIWDVRRSSSSTAPNLLRTLRTPAESGPVSCIVAFPDGQHVATASQDNIRLWNTVEYFEPEDSTDPTSLTFKKPRSRPPFKIVAGHHGGTVSSMLVDPTCRFMTVASGDRGWAGESTKVVLIHEVKW